MTLALWGKDDLNHRSLIYSLMVLPNAGSRSSLGRPVSLHVASLKDGNRK